MPRLRHPRPALGSALLLVLGGLSFAVGEEPAPAPAPAPAAVPAPATPPAAAPAAPGAPTASKSMLSEEELWVFEPPIGRPDVLFDLETRLLLEKRLAALKERGVDTPGVQAGPVNTNLEWARKELERIESFIVQRRWDEAIKTADNAIKFLQRNPETLTPAINLEVERLKRFKIQAEEAKIYEEAQAAFDALNLRIEGILWSPAGSLAVISNEPRALAINDRVKGCILINIDTNRVDFLYIHTNRRRFEFQRYVGEEPKPTATKAK